MGQVLPSVRYRDDQNAEPGLFIVFSLWRAVGDFFGIWDFSFFERYPDVVRINISVATFDRFQRDNEDRDFIDRRISSRDLVKGPFGIPIGSIRDIRWAAASRTFGPDALEIYRSARRKRYP